MKIQLSLKNDVQTTPGQQVVMPVFLDPLDDVIGSTIDVRFDPKILQIENDDRYGCKSVSLGPAWPPAKGFNLIANVVIPGWLRIVAYGSVPQEGADGEIARIAFTVAPEAVVDMTSLTIQPASKSEAGHDWLGGEYQIEIVGGSAVIEGTSHNHIVAPIPQENWYTKGDLVIKEVSLLLTDEEVITAIRRAKAAGAHLPTETFLHVWTDEEAETS